MNKTQTRKFISELFGFKQTSITLLEGGETAGQFSYLMFEVSKIQYQARKQLNLKWELSIYSQNVSN